MSDSSTPTSGQSDPTWHATVIGLALLAPHGHAADSNGLKREAAADLARQVEVFVLDHCAGWVCSGDPGFEADAEVRFDPRSEVVCWRVWRYLFASVMQNLFRHQFIIVVASGDCVALPND